MSIFNWLFKNKSISDYEIFVAPSGRKYLDRNLGTDHIYPYGKHYTFDEANKLCPYGTRLPTMDEVAEDINWLIKILPFGASGQGGKIGFIGYYWTGEDKDVIPGSAIFFCVVSDGDSLIQVANKDERYLVRCLVI